MNKILKILTLSDVFLFTGFGFVAPILAIFIKENLIGGTIAAAGLASAIFLIVHAVLQIIFAKVFNPKDRLWMLLVGTVIICIVTFGYMLATRVTHLYIVQALYGIGAGLQYPSWYSLFASNLEKGRRGLDWSIYSSCVGIGTAVAAYLGAIVATKFGFNSVFFLAGALGIAAFVVLFALEKKALKKI